MAVKIHGDCSPDQSSRRAVRWLRELNDIASTLPKLCGTGCTAKNGVVELQGDHRDRVVAFLQEHGRRVKRAGG